jgi:CO/xanthine dehydrogenase FAD-binding subunit
MPQRPRNYHRPESLAEALQMLSQPDTAPLAGGTRLLVGDVTVGTVIDLQKLGLNAITMEADGLHIGATAKLTDIVESDALQGDPREVLLQAIRASGPNTFRNAATLGGIAGGRESSSELLALLLALNADLQLAHADNSRRMSLTEYLVSDVKPAGLITKIMVPWGAGTGAIHRVARTPADQPIVAVAGWRHEHEALRLAAVGISMRPIGLLSVTGDITQSTIDAAISTARDIVSHPGDFLGSRDYRQQMVGVLVARVIQDCS